MKSHMRKHLNAEALLKKVRHCFDRIKDPLGDRTQFNLTDCLLSGLAIFGIKYSSLLQFDKSYHDTSIVRHNLAHLYGVENAPCDTYLRERLDTLDAKRLNSGFKAVLSEVQHSHLLELYDFMEGYHLVPIDGTGVFYSDNVHCKNCCERHHRDGSVSYYHQLLAATLVHPDYKPVLPLTCEPIKQQDGRKKNDCELNASKRLLSTLRHMHPKLKMAVVEDALYANGPHIRQLQELGMRYLIVVKPKNHRWLFDWVKQSERESLEQREGEVTQRFEWVNDVPLNYDNDDIQVNFLEYWETDKHGKVHNWTWITDFPLTKKTVYRIMRGGRARWQIENQTFNTLKNQGYQFEHNFGHGYQHLTEVFTHLMLLAFLIDQVQELACPLFQKALAKAGRKLYFWERVKNYFLIAYIKSWEAFYQAIINTPEIIFGGDTAFDTS